MSEAKIASLGIVYLHIYYFLNISNVFNFFLLCLKLFPTGALYAATWLLPAGSNNIIKINQPDF